MRPSPTPHHHRGGSASLSCSAYAQVHTRHSTKNMHRCAIGIIWAETMAPGRHSAVLTSYRKQLYAFWYTGQAHCCEWWKICSHLLCSEKKIENMFQDWKKNNHQIMFATPFLVNINILLANFQIKCRTVIRYSTQKFDHISLPDSYKSCLIRGKSIPYFTVMLYYLHSHTLLLPGTAFWKEVHLWTTIFKSEIQKE